MENTMQYAVATCYSGTDEEVEARIRDLGFPVIRLTLHKMGRSLSAYPGYIFVDPAYHPDVIPVSGFERYLIVDDRVTVVDENDLFALQVQLNGMFADISNDYVFDNIFGPDRTQDYFETFGTRVFESIVNVNRFPKGVRHAVTA